MPVIPNLDDIESKYRDLLNLPPEKRTSGALAPLYGLEARIRKLTGLPDSQNPARQALVRAGIRKLPAFALLAEMGVLSALQRHGLKRHDLYALQRVLRAARKDRIEELAPDDWLAELYEQPSGSPRHSERARLRRCVRACQEMLGDAFDAPNLDVVRRLAPRSTDFSAATQAGLLRLAEHDEASNLTRVTKASNRKRQLYQARRLEMEDGNSSGKGLIAAFLDDKTVLRYATSQAQPRADGTYPAHTTWQGRTLSILHLWSAAGLSHKQRHEKLARLLSSLNNDGSPNWRVDRLNLRAPNRSPAPSRMQVASAYAQFIRDLAYARKKGFVDMQHDVLLHRALFATAHMTGMRLASLVSMRADKIRVNDQGEWSIEVKAKRTRRGVGQRPTPRRMIGDEEWAEWILDGTLIPMYEELFRAHGLDLKGYVQSNYGKRELLRWIRPTEDETFGRQSLGVEVAPLWLTSRTKNGYLKRAGVVYVIKSVLRRAGKVTGGPHSLRRRALLDHRADSIRNPRLVEKVFQASRQTQDHYSLSDDMDTAEIVARYDPFDPKGSVRGPTPPGAAVAEEAESSASSPRALRNGGQKTRTRPRLSAKQLLGR